MEGMTSDDLCDRIAINIEALLKTRAPDLTSDCCIYRVDRSNDEAFTPSVISFGPFHHGKYKMMEQQKKRYLFRFINRTKLTLKNFVTFTKNSEERIRRCYAETIELQTEDFVKMILLDGSFIIEYFLKEYFERKDKSDTILFNQQLEDDICTDLILLENQLPFWFLENLYNLRFSNDPDVSFIKVVCSFFSNFNERDITPQNDILILHFTDLIRIFNLPYNSRKEPTRDGNNRRDFSCSAVDLHAAGVKFKANLSKCLFDIEFSANDGVLSFPQFKIEGGTEALVKNLMALEQYHYPQQPYICDYIVLMNSLIDTAKDVSILVNKGIVNNWLGDQAALATLINRMDDGIIHSASDSYFCKLNDDLTEYYEKRWHKWISNLKQDYFSTPWKIVSIIAAAILLILTFIQTINSFY